MATLTLDPTEVKVYYGAPSGVGPHRSFAIDITTGDLYYTADGTGDWTLLSTGGGNLVSGTTAITSGSDGSILIQLAGKVSEDANLTWDAANGLAVGKPVAVTGSVTATGALITSLNAAPADGALVAGQLAIWYDDTNGAGKIMFKAKQADGTVKTGSVAVNT